MLLSLAKRTHKWLAVFVAIQMIIWIGTGIYFNLVNHDYASGNTLRVKVNHQGELPQQPLFRIQDLPIDKVQQLDMVWIDKSLYYRVIYNQSAHSYQAKSIELFDASTGQLVSLNKDRVSNIANDSLRVKHNILSTSLLSPPIDDLPNYSIPLWQVKYEDPNQTTVYIDPTNGRVVAHINNARRIHNLMFKLHFMDYANTGGFNHWLIIPFAIGALLLSLSGIVWLIEKFKLGHLKLKFGTNQELTTVHISKLNKTLRLPLDCDLSIFDAFRQNNLMLPSVCGGGGTCGSCKVKIDKKTKVLNSDKTHISPNKLAEGFRLACQHKCNDIGSITVKSFLNEEK